MKRSVAWLACVLALTAALLAGGGCARAGSGSPLGIRSASALPVSRGSRVVVVMMENEEAGAVLGSPRAPYANALARRYGLATRSYAITHPSLPNYLALTSGAVHGISSDCSACHVAAPNIVDQLEAAGISWTAYLEEDPNSCFTGAAAGGYAKRHNPFIYYDDIASSPARCQHLAGFGALARDLRHGSLPRYTWISPNLCNDGHDCGVAGGDRFLARTVPALLHELGPHGFLVVSWDEGATDQGCCGGAARGGHIATIVAGPDVRRGARDNRPVDHYGVLGTIEAAFGLPPLAGARDPNSGRLTSLFTRAPHLG